MIEADETQRNPGFWDAGAEMLDCEMRYLVSYARAYFVCSGHYCYAYPPPLPVLITATTHHRPGKELLFSSCNNTVPGYRSGI